jgi:hypothetical protein
MYSFVTYMRLHTRLYDSMLEQMTLNSLHLRHLCEVCSRNVHKAAIVTLACLGQVAMQSSGTYRRVCVKIT